MDAALLLKPYVMTDKDRPDDGDVDKLVRDLAKAVKTNNDNEISKWIQASWL